MTLPLTTFYARLFDYYCSWSFLHTNPKYTFSYNLMSIMCVCMCSCNQKISRLKMLLINCVTKCVCLLTDCPIDKNILLVCFTLDFQNWSAVINKIRKDWNFGKRTSMQRLRDIMSVSMTINSEELSSCKLLGSIINLSLIHIWRCRRRG